MKLYHGTGLPCPRRVTIYLAEKGLEIERIEIDTQAGEQRSAEFLRINPLGKIPVLQLDDGTFLPESSAIVEYLEELFPNPSMLGNTPESRAHARALERMAAELFMLQGHMLLNTHPAAKKRFADREQYPDTGKALQPTLDRLLQALETRIGQQPFLAGAHPTAADCTLFAGLDTATRFFDYELPASLPALRRWFERFGRRPSAKAM